MSINGFFYGATGNGWIKPRIQWSAESNTEGNYTDVTATLSYTRTNYGYTTYGYWAGSLTIHGDRKAVSGVYTEITEQGYRDILTHTVRVYHDDDGTKTITISADGSISGTTLTYTVISADVKLEDIPRAASISATDADIGAVSTVSIHRTSPRYTHTVAWRFGTCTGYLSETGLSDSAVKLTRDSVPFSLPESFYYEIPDAPAGVCTLICTTYRGDVAVGEPQQTTFTVRADPTKCAPLLTAGAEDTNPVTLALTGDADKAVRYGSHMVCSISCEGRFGAAVTEKWIAGTSVSEDTLDLQGYDGEAIRFAVRDSRGYVTEKILTPEVVPYYSPTGLLSVSRTDATSGNAVLTVRGSFFAGSFGARDNALQLRYRVGSGEWVSLAADVDESDYTASANLSGLSYTNAHRIQLEVTDAVNTLQLSATVSPGVPVFDWGKADFRFRVPVTAPMVTGLSAPSEDTDAANKAYADTKLALTGGRMQGELDMGTYRISGLREPAVSTDAATKAYADTKMGMTLLWENASPVSEFPAQTIPLPLAGYTHIAVECKWTASDSWSHQEVKVFRKDNTSDGCILGFVGADTGIVSRGITAITDSGISFSNGKNWNLEAGRMHDNNFVCLPMKIFGVQGGME